MEVLLIILAIYFVGGVIGYCFMRTTKEHHPWAMVFAVLWPGILCYMAYEALRSLWRGDD